MSRQESVLSLSLGAPGRWASSIQVQACLSVANRPPEPDSHLPWCGSPVTGDIGPGGSICPCIYAAAPQQLEFWFLVAMGTWRLQQPSGVGRGGTTFLLPLLPGGPRAQPLAQSCFLESSPGTVRPVTRPPAGVHHRSRMERGRQEGSFEKGTED